MEKIIKGSGEKGEGWGITHRKKERKLVNKGFRWKKNKNWKYKSENKKGEARKREKRGDKRWERSKGKRGEKEREGGQEEDKREGEG